MNDSRDSKCTMIYQGVTRTLDTGEVILTGRIEYPQQANHMSSLLGEQYQGISVSVQDWDPIKNNIKNGDILTFDLTGDIKNIVINKSGNDQPGREQDAIYVLGADYLEVIKPRFDNVVKFPGSKYPKLRPL